MSTLTKWLGMFAILGALLVSACSVSGANAGDSNEPTTKTPVAHVFEIKDFVFSPATLSVKPGDTITWTNLDIVPHTATANDKSWDSKELKTGESYTITVTTATFAGYFCVYHPSMVATLNVSKN